MTSRIRLACWSLCAGLTACSPASAEATSEELVVLVDVELPMHELAVVGCMQSNPEDFGDTSLQVRAEFSPLDADSDAMILLTRVLHAGEEAADERRVDASGEVDFYLYDLDWIRSDDQWCATERVQMSHLEGAAMEVTWEATLSVDHFSDEPRGLSARIEEL